MDKVELRRGVTPLHPRAFEGGKVGLYTKAITDSNTMPRILLINDTSDHANWGSQATAHALCDIIRNAYDEAVEITPLYSAWTKQKYWKRPRWLGGSIVTRRLQFIDHWTRHFRHLPVVADEFEAVATAWERGEGGPAADEYIAHLDGVDAVVFNAEGAVYRNNDSAILGLFLLWYAKTRRGISAHFTNGSITLTRVDPVLPAMVARTFRAIDSVAVREPVSLQNLHEWYPDLDATVIPDAVFFYGEEQAASEENLTRAFGPVLKNGYACFSLSMLPNDYKRDPEGSALLSLVRLMRDVAGEVVLMAKDREDQFLKDVAKRSGSVFFGPEHSYQEQMALLRRASFLVSGRYHHNIMAMIMGCPSIPLTTTSHKVEGLCELAEGELGRAIDATYLRPELANIRARAEMLVAEREARREKLHDVADRLRAATHEMGHLIAGQHSSALRSSLR